MKFEKGYYEELVNGKKYIYLDIYLQMNLDF